MPGDLALFADASSDPGNEGILTLRALPVLLRDVPTDARVLLVSSLFAQVPYEYYVLPRPFRMLLVWSDQVLALIDQHLPQLSVEARRRQERLRGWDALLTAESLARGVAWAQFVVVAGPWLPELELHKARLEAVGEPRPQFAVYRVRP